MPSWNFLTKYIWDVYGEISGKTLPFSPFPCGPLSPRLLSLLPSLCCKSFCIYMHIFFPNMFLLCSGMGPDSRVLVRKSRKQAEQYHRLYKVCLYYFHELLRNIKKVTMHTSHLHLYLYPCSFIIGSGSCCHIYREYQAFAIFVYYDIMGHARSSKFLIHAARIS